jgi:hypothetical protein
LLPFSEFVPFTLTFSWLFWSCFSRSRLLLFASKGPFIYANLN